MAWFQEIIDFVMKMKPWTTVNEYESGLYFWTGRVRTWHLSDKKLEWILKARKESGFGKNITLEEVLKQEKEIKKLYKKTKKFDSVQIEEGWRKGFLNCAFGWNPFRGYRILHPERSTKNLPYGLYWHLPSVLDVSRVETVPTTEVVKELKFMSGLLKYDKSDILFIDGDGCDNGLALSLNKRDDKGNLLSLDKSEIEKIVNSYGTHATPFSLSGIVRYKIEDAYKAYTKVTDYERSYQSQILLTLSEKVREMTINDWVNPEKVTVFRKDFKEKLNDSVSGARNKWGIYTIEFGFTEISTRNLQRHSQELYVPDEGLKVKVDMPR
jgi:hypothetical protein